MYIPLRVPADSVLAGKWQHPLRYPFVNRLNDGRFINISASPQFRLHQRSNRLRHVGNTTENHHIHFHTLALEGCWLSPGISVLMQSNTRQVTWTCSCEVSCQHGRWDEQVMLAMNFVMLHDAMVASYPTGILRNCLAMWCT